MRWRSQQRTAHAQAQGLAGRGDHCQCKSAMAAKASPLMKTNIRALSITPEQLAKLKPLLGTDSTITAGNASGLNDGACALLLASAAALDKHGLQPLAASSARRRPELLRGSWALGQCQRSTNC